MLHCACWEAKEVNVLADDLVVGLGRRVVLLSPLLGIRELRDQGNVHVKVVGVLDGANNLLQLVLEVLAALVAHHEVAIFGGFV